MNAMKTLCLAAIVAAAITGCSGLNTLQKLPADQQADLFQDLNKNQADYRIHQCPGLIVIDPKSDSRSIDVVGEKCRAVDHLPASFSPETGRYWTFRSLVGNNGELFGYVFWNYRVVRAGAREVGDSTMRVWYHKVEYGGR